jgi:hypothetical protein
MQSASERAFSLRRQTKTAWRHHPRAAQRGTQVVDLPADRQTQGAQRPPESFLVNRSGMCGGSGLPFASFDAKTAARRGTHIATVAVARKLLARCFHVLTEPQTTAGEVNLRGALAPSHVPETRPTD